MALGQQVGNKRVTTGSYAFTCYSAEPACAHGQKLGTSSVQTVRIARTHVSHSEDPNMCRPKMQVLHRQVLKP